MSKRPPVVDVCLAIFNLSTNEELHQVFKAAQNRQAQLAESAGMHFVIGDKVRFDSREGVHLTGWVLKINRKTIKVAVPSVLGITAPRKLWNVSPLFLEKVT